MKKQNVLSEYGFQRVPDHVASNAVCQDCRGEFVNRVLFTQESLIEPKTLKAYYAWFDRVRLNCYCKFHALKRVES